jgi:hypothetical protein
MEVIIGILLALLIIYRIVKTIQKIFQLLTLMEFWCGLLGNFVVYIMLEIISRTLFDKGFLESNLYFIGLGIVLWILLIIYIPILRLPLILLILIISLGLVIFRIAENFGVFDSGEDKVFVNPHEVSGYDRSDGTHVNPYWRDGDGNTNINLTADKGGGYFRSK